MNAFKRPRTTQELAEHVAELCMRFKLMVEYRTDVPPHGSDSVHAKLQGTIISGIRVQPITDETSYAVAMHEIGHGLHPLGLAGKFQNNPYEDARLKLLRERSAWEWAEQNALDWSPTMQAVRDMCLKSYTDSVQKEKNALKFIQDLAGSVLGKTYDENNMHELLRDLNTHVPPPPPPATPVAETPEQVKRRDAGLKSFIKKVSS